MEQTPNKSQHAKLTLEKKILPPLLLGFELTTVDHESGALTNKLSRLPISRGYSETGGGEGWPIFRRIKA